MKLLKSAKIHAVTAAVIIVSVTATGIYILQNSRAASTAVSSEAENGTLTNGATQMVDTSASGGKSVLFGSSRTVKAQAYGAVCDGVHDDRAAIDAALIDLGKTGGGVLDIPAGDCRMLQTAQSVYTGIGANITIQGTSTSRISLACDKPNGYNEMFRINGDNVSFVNISLVRTTACSGIMLSIHPSSNFSLHNVTLDGQAPLLAGSMHGLALASVTNGVYKNITLNGSTVRNFSYGFFQPNQAQTSTDGFMVEDCTFTGNGADDLEFNAPSGTMTNVTVKDSRFARNRASGAGAGFGVGLANVQTGLITNNAFDTYAREPVHIEDRSRDITVQDNTFTNSFTEAASYASHVFIVNNSHFITVRRNRFDTTGNSSAIKTIFIGSGGSNFTFPSDITISDNTFLLRPTATKIYASGVARVVESGSIVTNIP